MHVPGMYWKSLGTGVLRALGPGWAQCFMLTIPALWKAEIEGSLEPRSSGSAWTTL